MDMKVNDYMSKDVISVDKDDSLRHVMKLMKKHDVTKIPVLEEKKLIGITTDNIIAYKLGSKRKREVTAARLHASSVIEKDFTAVKPDTKIQTVLKKVGEPGPTMLPVVENEKLVGVLTKADLLVLVNEKKAVHTIMQKNVHAVDPTDRVIHARHIMITENVARLPVVKQGRLVGMISDKEIAFSLASIKRSFKLGRQKHQLEELLVGDVMKIPAIWIPHNTSISAAAKVMIKQNVGALPIIQDDVITGIITRTDLLKTLSL